MSESGDIAIKLATEAATQGQSEGWFYTTLGNSGTPRLFWELVNGLSKSFTANIPERAKDIIHNVATAVIEKQSDQMDDEDAKNLFVLSANSNTHRAESRSSDAEKVDFWAGAGIALVQAAGRGTLEPEEIRYAVRTLRKARKAYQSSQDPKWPSAALFEARAITLLTPYFAEPSDSLNAALDAEELLHQCEQYIFQKDRYYGHLMRWMGDNYAEKSKWSSDPASDLDKAQEYISVAYEWFQSQAK